MNRSEHPTSSPPEIQPRTSRWSIARGAQLVWRRTREASAALPAGAWRRWWVTLLVAFVVLVGLSILTSMVAQRLAPRGMDEWDARTLRWLEQRGPMSFPDAILIESPGNLAYLIPVTAAVAIIALVKRRAVFAASVVASYVLMRLIVLAGWMTWDRPRPQLILDGAAAPPLHSFPSGHIALALSVYGLLAYLWFERSRSIVERTLIVLLLLLWCGVVGIARVRLGAHWPSDLIGGAILGVLWLLGVILALRRAQLARWVRGEPSRL
jgi:undecaprenyl-diphosphatase